MRDYLRFPVYAADALPAGAAAPAAAAAAPAVTPAAAPVAGQPAAADPTAGAKLEPNIIATATDKPADPTKVDAKPADARPGEAKPADKPADAKPVEFTDFKVPDGITLGTEAVGEFKTLAGELNLDQAGAQKLVDLYTKSAMEAANAPYKLWEETQSQWQKEIKADPELGGAKYVTSMANISKAIDRFGGKEATAMRQAFEFTGAGNNPEITRLLARVGSFIAENPNVTGRAPTTPTDRASRMFPSLAAKAAG